ncbi:MAG TPA: recombinase family protein [Gemmataceae bacterium]|jgi:DNA invertase Pin-like site-specific DNA recombinase
MRTADYYRMSTDKQETSIPQQMAGLLPMAQKERLQIVATYKDEGISGGANDRPELQRLIREAKAHRIEAVACYALDRLSRSDAMAAMAEVFYPLKQAGVRYIYTTNKSRIDLHNIMDQTLLGITQNHTSHQEKVNIADRTSRSRREFWLQGYWISNKLPYGYRIVDRRDNKFRGPGTGAGKLSVHEPQAQEVRRCFDLYEQLRSTRLVALAMGQSIYWVQDKLDRAVYCGRLQEPKKRIGKHYRFSLDRREDTQPDMKARDYRCKDDAKWVEGVYPAIITTEQFDRVQALRKANRANGKQLRQKRRGHLFSQLLYCGDCGSMMFGKKYPTPRYMCSGHAKGTGCQQPRDVRENVLKEAVLHQIKKDIKNAGGIETIRRLLLDGADAAAAKSNKQHAELKRQLANWDENIAQARKGLLRLLSVSEDIYKDAVRDVERMMKEREELAHHLSAQAREEDHRQRLTKMVEKMLEGLGAPEVQGIYLAAFLHRIDLHWERMPGERKRGQYRLTGGVITYKRIQQFIDLLGAGHCVRFYVPQRQCIPSNNPETAGDGLPRRPAV